MRCHSFVSYLVSDSAIVAKSYNKSNYDEGNKKRITRGITFQRPSIKITGRGLSAKFQGGMCRK